MPHVRYLPGMSRILDLLQRVRRFANPHRELISITLISIAAAVILAGLVNRIQPDERVVVGNTGGTLTTLIELQEARILVGAGPSRSHSADLLGRTTRPWDRDIELLILPGWDDHHVSGALGLLERRTVNGIAIVGLPGAEPLWTILEREAESRGVELTYIDRASQLKVSSTSALLISPIDGIDDGAWVRLDHQGKRIDVLDTGNVDLARPDRSSMQPGGEHVIVNTRGHRSPGAMKPPLLMTPRPYWQSDFAEISADKWAPVDRNEHVTLTLEADQIRLPLESVQFRPD
jgi:hypothetical protein